LPVAQQLKVEESRGVAPPPSSWIREPTLDSQRWDNIPSQNRPKQGGASRFAPSVNGTCVVAVGGDLSNLSAFVQRRRWLKRGVDGFRVDVLWHLIKDDRRRDNPPNPDYTTAMPSHLRYLPLYTTDRPEVLGVVAGLRQVVDEFDDRALLGEIYLPLDRLMAYYGRDLGGVHLPFNFQLLDRSEPTPRKPPNSITAKRTCPECLSIMRSSTEPSFARRHGGCPCSLMDDSP